MRTCLGCGGRELKSVMVRIARSGERVVVDAGSRLPGRGGYLHQRRECLERFVNSRSREFRSLRLRLDRQARIEIAGAIMRQLASAAVAAKID